MSATLPKPHKPLKKRKLLRDVVELFRCFESGQNRKINGELAGDIALEMCRMRQSDYMQDLAHNFWEVAMNSDDGIVVASKKSNPVALLGFFIVSWARLDWKRMVRGNIDDKSLVKIILAIELIYETEIEVFDYRSSDGLDADCYFLGPAY